MFGHKPKTEHRKYLRLDTTFPVQFRLESPDGGLNFTGWLQGFTNNVSGGGICLSVNKPGAELYRLLKEKNPKISLEIEVPISSRPIPARAAIAWLREVPAGVPKILIGLKYEQIPARQNKRLMRYAWFKKLFPAVSLSLLVVLIIALSINASVNSRLTENNKLLIEKLSAVLKESSLAKENLEGLTKKRQILQLQLRSLEKRIKSIELQKVKTESLKASMEANDLQEIARLNDLIINLTKEKTLLDQKFTGALEKENVAVKEISELDREKVLLEKANFEKMYQWLKIHQNKSSGLLMSFEGDKDIANWAFTYDLALATQAYSYFGDFDRAKKILNFFANSAERENGWFLNAYYANDGAPAEFIMHSGPNLWLGLAIMQYTQSSKDKSYLDLAQDIAQTVIKLQNADKEGGIKGGPGVNWYSTEHNLDAYALFSMLSKVTGEKIYSRAADKTLAWLLNHTYDRPDLPVRRGKGDSTIATDTYAWSIAALGPEKLIEMGMDPDKIMEFVEENCSVEVNFAKPDGKNIKIRGFDFAPERHTARGGVVSSEWTAQMVVSYKMMEDFYAKKSNLGKAQYYKKKAQRYLGELSNMIISSASPSGQGQGCLPYATQDHVDTGHGWMTPKGSHTGSVSGTVYTIFAYHGFNPLLLKE